MKAIAAATLHEAVRKKTFIMLVVISIIYLILWSVLLNHFENGEGMRHIRPQFKEFAAVMITQAGLQFSSMLLCLITIMLGAGVIASELETGMVHAIITRPLRRAEYVLGKFAGLFILMFVYATFLLFMMLAISSAFSLSTVTNLDLPTIFKTWLLFLSVPLAVLCVTINGSVSFKTVPCGLLMIAVYILGNIGGMVEMIGLYLNNDPVMSAGVFLSLVSPFHILYTAAEQTLISSSGLASDMMRMAGGLTGSGRPPSAWMFVYIGAFCMFFLNRAVRKFERMDIS